MSLAGLSRWCYRRRRSVVILWVVGFVVFNVVGASLGDDYSDNFSGGHSDSIDAFNLLQDRFPARAGDTAEIVFTSKKGVDDPAVREAMDGLFAKVGPGHVEHLVALDSPYLSLGRVSPDRTVAYATATYDDQAGDLPSKAAQPLIDAADDVHVPGLTIELSGPVVARALEQSPGGAEGIGLIAAVIILFLAFGSLLAMSLPVLAAVFGVGDRKSVV